MEVGLIILLFVVNALAMDCLYNQRYKSTGIILIVNMCLSVALAYQFQQVEKIVKLLVVVAGVIVLYFVLKYFLMKKKKQKERNQIEEKK